MKKLSLVVPCYNEGENIRIFCKKVTEIFNQGKTNLHPDEFELLFVSDGPEESFIEILHEVEAQYGYVTAIIFPENKGYGFSVLKGLEQATGEFLARTHADLQTDPYDVFRGYHIIEQSENNQQNIFVKGWRKGRPWSDQIFSRGMGLFESIYMGTGMQEINAQPNVFHRSFFESWVDAPHDFALDLYVYYMAKLQKLDIRRIDVCFPERIYGASKWNISWKAKWKFIKRTIKFSFALKSSLSK